MSKTYTVTVFNTITLQYEEIKVTRAVYNEFRRGKWRISTQEMPPRIPLVGNPEFKTVKNAVIQETIKQHIRFYHSLI